MPTCYAKFIRFETMFVYYGRELTTLAKFVLATRFSKDAEQIYQNSSMLEELEAEIL